MAKFKGVVRCFLAGFDHDGIPANESRGHFSGDEKEREIPRQNAPHDTDRLAEEKDGLAGPVARDNLAFDAARPLGHVIDVVGGEIHFDLGQAERFALFLDDDSRERLHIFTELGRDLPEEVGALDGGALGPCGLGGMGGVEGHFEVAGGGFRDARNDLAGGGIEDFDGAVTS